MAWHPLAQSLGAAIAVTLAGPSHAQVGPADITLSCGLETIGISGVVNTATVEIWLLKNLIRWTITGGPVEILPAVISPTQISFYGQGVSWRGSPGTKDGSIDRLTGRFSYKDDRGDGKSLSYSGTCVPAKPRF